MDDDGFFMAEIDGVRGLVPSNFLTDADQYPGGGQPGQGTYFFVIKQKIKNLVLLCAGAEAD